MRTHTFRKTAKRLLAIYVLCNVYFVFTGIADASCESERNRVQIEENDLREAQRARDNQSSPVVTIIIHTGISATTGAIAGTVIPGAGTVGGGIGGAIGGLGSGAYAVYTQHSSGQAQVEQAERDLAAAKKALENCESYQSYSSSQYGYHCSYCNTSWSFNSYDEYMSFSHDHQ